MADAYAIRGGELADALSGTTTTDLKIRIRRLEKELEDFKGSKDKEEESRVLVLESLLEDANRMKGRYESEYLKEHREKLVLVAEMEEIRAGRGDGGEAAIALRQRLNQLVDELDVLKKKHTEMEVKYERMERELTIAKSDCELIKLCRWQSSHLYADRPSDSESCQQRSSRHSPLAPRNLESRQGNPRI
jgi:protein HOOK3